MQEKNFRKVLKASTFNLSDQTRAWLLAGDFTRDDGCRPWGAKLPFGFILLAEQLDHSVPSAAHAPPGRYPADLWAIMAAADAEGCGYIIFDVDEPVLMDFDGAEDHRPTDREMPTSDRPILDPLDQSDAIDHGWSAQDSIYASPEDAENGPAEAPAPLRSVHTEGEDSMAVPEGLDI